jgi:hypothetical protein
VRENPEMPFSGFFYFCIGSNLFTMRYIGFVTELFFNRKHFSSTLIWANPCGVGLYAISFLPKKAKKDAAAIPFAKEK